MEALHPTPPALARSTVLEDSPWSLEPGDDIPEADQWPGILVIDNDVRVRAALRAGLEHQGFHVWLATSGSEAVELYRRLADRVALMLLEAHMPGMDGPETLAALRALNPALCCCFMTDSPSVYWLSDPHLLGVARVFTKPFDVLEMAPILRKLAGLSAANGC
jgi:CheY-like chemotaxis protein